MAQAKANFITKNNQAEPLLGADVIRPDTGKKRRAKTPKVGNITPTNSKSWSDRAKTNFITKNS